jgi:hypothetical protein
LVHRPVNWIDRQLLALAMASDFSVTWQCLSKRTIGIVHFSLGLHFLVFPFFVVIMSDDDLKAALADGDVVKAAKLIFGFTA